MYRAEPVLNQHLEVMKHQRAFQLHTERLRTQKSTIDQSMPPPCPRLQIYRERRTKELEELKKFSQLRLEMITEITGYHGEEKRQPLSARISLKPNITKPAIAKTKRIHSAREEDEEKDENPQEQKQEVQEPKKQSPKKSTKRTNPRRKGKKLPVVQSVDEGEMGFIAEIDSKPEGENNQSEEANETKSEENTENKEIENENNKNDLSLKKEIVEKLEGEENQEEHQTEEKPTDENQEENNEAQPQEQAPPQETAYTGITIADHVEEVADKMDGDNNEQKKEEETKENEDDFDDDFADADDERPQQDKQDPSESSFNGMLLDKLVPSVEQQEEKQESNETNLGRTFSNDFDLTATGETQKSNDDTDFESTLGNTFSLSGAVKSKLDEDGDHDPFEQNDDEENFEKDFD